MRRKRPLFELRFGPVTEAIRHAEKPVARLRAGAVALYVTADPLPNWLYGSVGATIVFRVYRSRKRADAVCRPDPSGIWFFNHNGASYRYYGPLVFPCKWAPSVELSIEVLRE